MLQQPELVDANLLTEPPVAREYFEHWWAHCERETCNHAISPERRLIVILRQPRHEYLDSSPILPIAVRLHPQHHASRC
eukprot:9467932-Pyramimonas_sp.AAC.1